MNRIREKRKAAGYSQQELGKLFGVGQTTVSAWETGRNEPRISTFYAMSILFGCSLGFLMGYEDEKEIQIIEDIADRFYQNMACG